MSSQYVSDSRPGYLTSVMTGDAWSIGNEDSSKGLRRRYSLVKEEKKYSLLAKCVAEFLGDLTFVFVGTMQSYTIGDAITHAALAHGFTIFIIVTALGHISGGHFNPAVSWAVVGTGKLPIHHFPFYMFSQLLGGFCGALLTAAVLNKDQLKMVMAGATLLSDDNQWWQGLISETIVTFFLVHTILITAVDSDKVTLAPLAIGLTLSIDILSTGTITGASMNPARSLGPSIVGSIFLPEISSKFWTYQYIYWAGPFLGSTIALAIYKLFEAREDRFIS
ncbi:unnamed protein product [Caenorhabditis bovis]|uniref:Aquaporin n=1 Tax=Caenorhabditis bovis TaxID=2654633 RepID=A0A8S1EC89_9PELO|nr:unnamed protein product [Caenorhabditis bovis]